MRELNLFIDKYQSKWAQEMKKLLTSSIILKKRMNQQDYQHCTERDEILKEFDWLICETIPEDTKKLHTLQRRLKKFSLGIFTFLFYPDVPPDNASERAIRNIKVKQKVSGEFRSDRGADIFAIIRSVLDTIIKKGGEPMPTIAFALDIDAQKRAMCKKINLILIRMFLIQ